MRLLTAEEGQVAVTDFALKRCNLCHSCQPSCLEKVISPDTVVMSQVECTAPQSASQTPGEQHQTRRTIPLSRGRAGGLSEQAGGVCSVAAPFFFMRRFLGSRSVTWCCIGRSRIPGDFMAVGAVSLTYSTLWAAVVQIRLKLRRFFNCDLSCDSDHKDFLSVWSRLDLKLCLGSERHSEGIKQIKLNYCLQTCSTLFSTGDHK